MDDSAPESSCSRGVALASDLETEPAPTTASLPHFTVRSVVAGLGVGTVICAANIYFGLQTGWVSIMSMPASLMGFCVFRLLRRHLQLPFTPVENVLLQSVACGMAIMPLGCGIVGVVPAMEYLLGPDEQGPLSLGIAQLVVWSLGLCYFGVVFSVPLRRQVIIRERLRFPSGFSTAVLISVLHGKGRTSASSETLHLAAEGGFASLVTPVREDAEAEADPEPEQDARQQSADWAVNLRNLVICFAVSGAFTVCTYFFPILRNLPIFGSQAAHVWLWTLNPSLAYVGQGIIMGAETTSHVALGAVVGWGLLSPLAKAKGWAPGPVDDWEHGSKGWIVWVSLAIMLSDAIVSLGYIALRPLVGPRLLYLPEELCRRIRLEGVKSLFRSRVHEYTAIPNQIMAGDQDTPSQSRAVEGRGEQQKSDAPPEQRIGGQIVAGGLAVHPALHPDDAFRIR